MNRHYLLFRSARNEFLLAMDEVVEVGLVPADAAPGSTHRHWRERVLNVRRLDNEITDGGKPHQLVVRCHDTLELLDVDEVIGLLQVHDDALLPFAPTHALTARRVDRALPRPGGHSALRLRWPPADDVEPGTAGEAEIVATDSAGQL